MRVRFVNSGVDVSATTWIGNVGVVVISPRNLQGMLG